MAPGGVVSRVVASVCVASIAWLGQTILAGAQETTALPEADYQDSFSPVQHRSFYNLSGAQVEKAPSAKAPQLSRQEEQFPVWTKMKGAPGDRLLQALPEQCASPGSGLSQPFYLPQRKYVYLQDRSLAHPAQPSSVSSPLRKPILVGHSTSFAPAGFDFLQYVDRLKR